MSDPTSATDPEKVVLQGDSPSGSDDTSIAAPQGARQSQESAIARFVRATEVDTRMLGMLGALLLIWVAFHLLSDGRFLTPRNLWNLSVQTSSVAIMSTGMVLIIVTRHIDLSVGSLLGFVAMIMGVTQINFLPSIVGLDHPATWIIALAVGLLLGAIIGDNVQTGINATIDAGTIIGNDAFVGPGAIFQGELAPNSKIM